MKHQELFLTLFSDLSQTHTILTNNFFYNFYHVVITYSLQAAPFETSQWLIGLPCLNKVWLDVIESAGAIKLSLHHNKTC